MPLRVRVVATPRSAECVVSVARYTRVSEERYGRGWRGERRGYARARVEGGYRSWRGERLAYRDRGVGVGIAAADQRLSHPASLRLCADLRGRLRDRSLTTTTRLAMMPP